MNDDTDDLALLRRYAESGCEEAFAALVARHIHYVYSVARRECASAHQAEEVTQAAFIILARKAGRLPSNTILSGWLFRTVRRTCMHSAADLQVCAIGDCSLVKCPVAPVAASVRERLEAATTACGNVATVLHQFAQVAQHRRRIANI